MWSKKETHRLTPPKPLILWHWIAIFILLLVISLIFALFIFSEKMIDNVAIYSLIIASFSILIFAIILAIRIMIYGVKEETVKLWDDELTRVDERWSQWSMQSLAIVKNISITPSNFSACNLIEGMASLSIKNHQVMLFEKADENFYQQFFKKVFLNLYEPLNQLASYPLTIVILNSSKEKINEEIIKQAYNNFDLTNSVSFLYPSPIQNEESFLNSLIDGVTDEQLYLLVANNSHHSSSSNFISCSLIIDPQLMVQSNSINISGLIRRTMVTQKDNVLSAIKQLCEIQPAFIKAECFWLSQMSDDEIMELKLAFCVLKDEFLHNKSLVSYPLDMYFGVPNNQLTYWLLVGFAAQGARITKQTQLVATKIDDSYLFTVITPP